MKLLARTTLLLTAVVAAAAAPVAAQQAGSIVFIDSERLRQEAPGLQEARTQLQQEMVQFQTRADSAIAPLQREFQELAMEFQQQQGTMSPEQRRQREQVLAQKRDQLQQRGAQLEQEAAAKQNEILAPALQRINQVIEQIREEQGYAYILDTAAGGVIAADPALDITGEVLQRLNAVANQDS